VRFTDGNSARPIPDCSLRGMHLFDMCKQPMSDHLHLVLPSLPSIPPSSEMLSSKPSDMPSTTMFQEFAQGTPFLSFDLKLGNALALVVFYLFIQRFLRHQRERRILRQYRLETASNRQSSIKSPIGAQDGGSQRADDGRLGLDLRKMTFTQASKIQKELVILEFPFTSEHSLQLGFIQVCSPIFSVFLRSC
jgi:hypothetical protein